MLRRKKPLIRKTPIKKSTKSISRTALKRSTKPINKKSSTQKERDKLYYPARKNHLENHPECQLKHPGICRWEATEIHHSAGKVGKLYWDERYFKSACRPCHDWAHDNVAEAKTLGYSVDRINK